MLAVTIVEPKVGERTLSFDQDEISIGRSASNEIVLGDNTRARGLSAPLPRNPPVPR